ncbi:hypothetical protein NDA16_000881 [Ustilago loliicola]|nr:hypothetical protein NDA16_000881 [Ustilago loliicola]
MSSTGAAAAGGSSGLSTLSTSLLAAACTAVVAATIFVLVALRRYLRAKKRKSILIATSPAPSSAAAIYASHIKAKSISTEDVSEPHLSYAPERAMNAQHNLSKMSLAQKTVVSMRQQGFFPSKPFASPKFPKAALLSPRMQPPLSADLPSPRTPKSPGLTELTMSPGPSILLKPMAYGKSPRLVSPSKDSSKEKKKETPEQKKKLTRSAEEEEVLADDKNQTAEQSKEADEPSLTPILDLGIDFGNDESFEQSLKLRGDFSFDQSNGAWLPTSSSADLRKQEQAQVSKQSAGMQSLIEALSPAQPETATLPSFKTSPPAKLSALPSPASFRSPLPTPPPSAGLPPAPTSVPMSKMPSSSSLQSKASRQTAASGASAPDSFHSATGSIGQICIDMPPIHTSASPRLGTDEEQEVLASTFRPLSLGLGPAKSPSQGTFNNILGSLRRPSRSEDVDLEATNSSSDELSTLRSYSSDNISYSSSQTSVDLEANTSIGKANIVPAASVPPLPPMPVSFARLAEDRTPQVQAMPVFVEETSFVDTDEVMVPPPQRKRASTLGALDRPKFVMPDLMHPRAAPVPPSHGTSAKIGEPTIHVESIEVNRASLMNLKAKSSDHLPLRGTGKGVPMNFMSSYHRTLIPDPPTDSMHLSPGLGADSPILSQLSPKQRGNSPSLSPKPGFAESLKARLSLSRKSITSSPGFNSRGSTPRLSTINQFPQPNGEGFETFAGEANEATTQSTPKMKPSKPVKAASRPATSPVVGMNGFGFSSPAILFNGQEMEPTKPLRFRKPGSAGGRLGGSPSSLLSPALASPSPMLYADHWGTPRATDSKILADASPSSIYSPLMAGAEGTHSPSGERIEFGMAQSSACSTPAAPAVEAMPNATSTHNSPQFDDTTPRPASADTGAFADEGEELEYLSHRDSMISVAASTISIMSNSTRMSDSIGEDLELAADRRAKLLASVQQNLAKAKVKDAKRESHAANRFRKSTMSQSSSLRNIPEEHQGGVQTMGLGLFESEEEVEGADEEEEERETLEDSPKSAASGYSRKKPNNLVLIPQHDSRLVAPLTPPLTPINGTAMQKQSRHAVTHSTSSASSASSAASVPRRMRPSRGGLAPIDTSAANRLSPGPDQLDRDGATSPSSLKLRPLSLAASLHGGDGSPMKRFERPAFSPALSANIPSPSPVHVAALNDRSSRYNEEGRSSRSTTYRQGGVLPTISSKGALATGRAGHAEPSLSHSDSTTSMGSMASSLGSFSRMGHFPSPVRSSFVNNGGMGKAMGMRSGMGSRGSVMSDMPEMPHSTSIQSFASSSNTHTVGGRLGYKTSDLSIAGM